MGFHGESQPQSDMLLQTGLHFPLRAFRNPFPNPVVVQLHLPVCQALVALSFYPPEHGVYT